METKAEQSQQAQQFYDQGKLAMNARNYKEMKKFFDQAVNLGNNSAMNDLAFYHQYIEIDHAKVVKYYLMSIEAGNINSCYNLGCFYHEQGDQENKVRYLTLASDKGDVRAHFGLGVYYEEQKNAEASYKFYKLAADNVVDKDISAKAHTALGDYFKNQGKFVEAKEEYLQALRGGNRDAHYCLDDRRITISSDERKEIFAILRKNLFPNIQAAVNSTTNSAKIKKETKSFIDEDGKEISYLFFTTDNKNNK